MKCCLSVLFLISHYSHCFLKKKRGEMTIQTRDDEEALRVLYSAEEHLMPLLEETFAIEIEGFMKFFSCLFIFTQLVEEDLDEILDVLMPTDEFKVFIKNYFEYQANDITYFLSMTSPDVIQRFLDTHHIYSHCLLLDDILMYVVEDNSGRCSYDGRFNEVVECRLNKYNLLRNAFERIVNTENDLNVVKAMVDRIICFYEIERRKNILFMDFLSLHY